MTARRRHAGRTRMPNEHLGLPRRNGSLISTSTGLPKTALKACFCQPSEHSQTEGGVRPLHTMGRRTRRRPERPATPRPARRRVRRRRAIASGRRRRSPRDRGSGMSPSSIGWRRTGRPPEGRCQGRPGRPSPRSHRGASRSAPGRTATASPRAWVRVSKRVAPPRLRSEQRGDRVRAKVECTGLFEEFLSIHDSSGVEAEGGRPARQGRAAGIE